MHFSDVYRNMYEVKITFIIVYRARKVKLKTGKIVNFRQTVYL